METLSELTPEDIYMYEASEHDDLVAAISKLINIPEKNIFLHNGSSELIKAIFSIVIQRGDPILLPKPCWSYYTSLAEYKFCDVHEYDILENETKCAHDVEGLIAAAEKCNPKMILITTPAMPTGNKISDEDLERIIKKFPDSLILVDEAYYGYAPYTLDAKRLIDTYDNVVFSRTFSKYYGLANLRIGYGFSSERLKSVLWLDLPLHALSHVAKRMAVVALEDKPYYDMVTEKIMATREKFIADLNQIPGVLAFKSDSNFVYIRCQGYDAEEVKRIVGEKGFLIRVFPSATNEKHLRITVGTQETMDQVMVVLKEAFAACKL